MHLPNTKCKVHFVRVFICLLNVCTKQPCHSERRMQDSIYNITFFFHKMLEHFGQISLEHSVYSNQPTWISCLICEFIGINTLFYGSIYVRFGTFKSWEPNATEHIRVSSSYEKRNKLHLSIEIRKKQIFTKKTGK